SLAIKADDTVTLNSYATALANAKQPERAFELFEQSLAIKADNTVTLTSYATALANASQPERAFELFDKSLAIKADDTVTLTSYATALANANQPERAFELFEQSLAIKADETVTLNSYATALANASQPERAFELFEQSLAIKADDTVTLNSYATALANANQPERAFELFEQSLAIKDDNPVTLTSQAALLEKMGKYQQALENFQKINLDKQTPSYVGFIYLNLGRLYYRLGKKNDSRHYFDLAMDRYAGHKPVARLTAAKNILAVNPYSEEALEILRDFTPHTPGYRQAFNLFSMNLDNENHFRLHNDSKADEEYDLELLNRTMYHKIQNEISILKGIAQRIAAKTESVQINAIVELIEGISAGIVKRRSAAKTELAHILADNYQHIIQAISDTAHDIVDFVNNEIAVVKERVRRLLRDSDNQRLKNLLEQVEFTESALNDLKSVNESVELRMETFPVGCLFENWRKNPRIENAEIVLDINNADTEFYGDEQKIKAFIKELVDNAIKHNTGQSDLCLRISARDIDKLPGSMLSGKLPLQKKYLSILFSDNGKGIPRDKKDWIFLPLKTTSKEGSGLGLFIIKRTVQSMKGYILETGQQGSRFEIYLPYGAKQWN
ncbi:ATP-binding protein, partial [Candidatus Venteria ishoeyi]|uniref:ATP-binding protein n=1 Tax=Candidatus Venteria ishoeyi TaxID=1899563 RepID=UPI0025A5FEB9